MVVENKEASLIASAHLHPSGMNPRPTALLIVLTILCAIVRNAGHDPANNTSMNTWHEDDAFWAQNGPQMFTIKRLEGTAKEIDGVLAMLSLRPGAAILDLPCGPGRHSNELAKRGFRVTAVDRTRAYLDHARANAEQVGLSIEWIEGDMRNFARPAAFDAVLNFYTSFGYFEDPREDLRVLENFRASLRPGGKLLIELLGKEILARTFKARTWQQELDGTIIVFENKVCQNWTWMQGRWMHIRDGKITTHHISHRIYSAAELLSLLKEAGFGECRVYGSIAGAPYDHEAERMVVVAERG